MHQKNWDEYLRLYKEKNLSDSNFLSILNEELDVVAQWSYSKSFMPRIYPTKSNIENMKLCYNALFIEQLKLILDAKQSNIPDTKVSKDTGGSKESKAVEVGKEKKILLNTSQFSEITTFLHEFRNIFSSISQLMKVFISYFFTFIVFLLRTFFIFILFDYFEFFYSFA